MVSASWGFPAGLSLTFCLTHLLSDSTISALWFSWVVCIKSGYSMVASFD